VLTDIAVHAGAAREWRGYQTKGSYGVVYFALERADLVKRRLVAYRERDQLETLPIAVAGEIIDLMNRSCVELIFSTIKRAEDRFGCGVGLAVIEALTEALLSEGRDAPREYELPLGVKVVRAERWKTELFRRNVLDKDNSNPRARFHELRQSLAARKLIGTRDDFVWSAAAPPASCETGAVRGTMYGPL
jgi:hypothetical protein